MQAPKTLTTLLHIAQSKVAKLEAEYSAVCARAVRTKSGPDESEKIIIESKLARARSRLASLKMQLKRESHEQKLVQ